MEHPERARKRVESAIVIQSLMRRFLARVLVCQVSLIFCTNHDYNTPCVRVPQGFYSRREAFASPER